MAVGTPVVDGPAGTAVVGTPVVDGPAGTTPVDMRTVPEGQADTDTLSAGGQQTLYKVRALQTSWVARRKIAEA